MQIGEKLKHLRIKINLTQEELANRAELSKGFISLLERDLTSPSIATLVDILECLGTNLKDFFNEPVNDKIVFQKDDVFVQENDDLGHSINWIIPNAQKNRMEPMLMHIQKGGKSSVYNAHEGEVFGYVLKGFLNIIIGSQNFKAKKGESFYYHANTSYCFENHSAGEVILLLVSTPPSF